jgi:acyl transferase domain-containing protein
LQPRSTCLRPRSRTKHFCGIAAPACPSRWSSPGETADLDKLAAELRGREEARRGSTEGAFHLLDGGAAQQFRQVLEQTEFSGVQTDVLSNYTGKLHENSPGDPLAVVLPAVQPRAMGELS